MDRFESSIDRQIREGREAGLFDNLPGAGKPLPDLGRERPAGWWGERLAARERSKLRSEQLDEEIREAMPGLWRLDEEGEVRALVIDLNRRIASYNRTTAWEQRAPLDEADLVATWQRFRRDDAGRG